MEVKEKSKKRELIKTIAIIFLTVLLVLLAGAGFLVLRKYKKDQE